MARMWRLGARRHAMLRRVALAVWHRQQRRLEVRALATWCEVARARKATLWLAKRAGLSAWHRELRAALNAWRALGTSASAQEALVAVAMRRWRERARARPFRTWRQLAQQHAMLRRAALAASRRLQRQAINGWRRGGASAEGDAGGEGEGHSHCC